MKGTLIYFSPCGSTRKVAELIKSEFVKYNWEIQMLDMTKDNDLFPNGDIEKFINKIEGHDLLLVGGPIYIDHLHYNVLKVLKALQLADGEKYSKDAAVFTTFGKITPGVGSLEAAIELKATGRNTWAAIEVDSEHCVARNIPYHISEGLPGREVETLVSQLVEYLIKIVDLKDKPLKGIAEKLKSRFDDFPKLMDERKVTKSSFPNIEFNYDLCKQCLLCVKKCPVNYLIVKDGYPVTSLIDSCVHCTNCLFYCPTGAVKMDLYDKEPFYRKQLKEQNLQPDGTSISSLILAD